MESKNRAFLESRHAATRPKAVTPFGLGFSSGGEDGSLLDEAVARRFGLVGGGLGAEAAILRARAGLGVDDGAEVNLVALELGTDAVGPGEQVVDVGGIPQAE